MSAYAKYWPSGEMAPLETGFSLELNVSCRCFTSGKPDTGDGRVQKRTLVMSKVKTPAIATRQSFANRLLTPPISFLWRIASASDFKSAPISDADW